MCHQHQRESKGKILRRGKKSLKEKRKWGVEDLKIRMKT